MRSYLPGQILAAICILALVVWCMATTKSRFWRAIQLAAFALGGLIALERMR